MAADLYGDGHSLCQYPFEVVNIKVECADLELNHRDGSNSDKQPCSNFWETCESSSDVPVAVLRTHVNSESHETVEVKYDPSSLRSISDDHHEKQLRCRDCQLNFSSAEVLKLHSVLHKVKPKRDRKKPSKSTKKLLVKCELRRSTDDNALSNCKYQCDLCARSYKNKASLAVHRKVHKGRKFRCDYCNKAFLTKPQVAAHLQIHESTHESHMCKVCFHVFTKLINFQVHLKSHQQDGLDTNIEESAIVSEVRAQSLQRQSKCVVSEITANHTKQTYECSYCSEVFFQEIECKKHETGHLYTCNICGKQFKMSYYLKLHMRTHTGEKPYGCVVCSKKFVTKSHLSRHMTGHDGLKLHNCRICNKSFSRKCYLRKHSGVHLKSKGDRVSFMQKKVLLDFMERHPTLAVATFNSPPSNSWRDDALWEEMALSLNGCGEGCSKTWQRWRNYWIDIKSKTKKRVSEVLAEHGARAGASRVPPLNEDELRINTIVSGSPLLRDRIARHLSKIL